MATGPSAAVTRGEDRVAYCWALIVWLPEHIQPKPLDTPFYFWSHPLSSVLGPVHLLGFVPVPLGVHFQSLYALDHWMCSCLWMLLFVYLSASFYVSCV